MKIVSTKKGRIIKETATVYLCIAPMLVALFVFTFYPIFQSFFDSFWDYRGFERVNFGIHNYVDAFKDPKFWIAWSEYILKLLTVKKCNTFLNITVVSYRLMVIKHYAQVL